MRWAILLVASGCIQSTSVVCSDRICPADTSCDELHHLCVFADQLTTCLQLDDGADCDIQQQPGGICRDHVCVPEGCGDGFVRGAERCDGADLAGKTDCRDLGYYASAPLTCAADCLYDTSTCGGGFCGDHVVNGPEFCDGGAAPVGSSCLDFGFDAGSLACTSFCSPGFDACETWGFAPAPSATSADLRGVWGTSSSDIFYVGAMGTILHDDGHQLTAMTSNTPNSLRAVWGATPTDVWAVGDTGTVVHWDGSAWTATQITQSGSFLSLNTVAGSSASDVYAAGESGALQHWNGSTWTPLVGVSNLYIAGLYVAASNDVYTAEYGLIRHFNGTAWAIEPGTTIASAAYTSIWGRNTNDVWAVGGDAGSGVIAHRVGTTWSLSSIAGADSSFTAVTGTSDGHVYIAGTRLGVPGVWFSDDDGATFEFLPSTALTNVFAFDRHDVRGIGKFGAIRRFRGTGWATISNPVGANRFEAAGTSALGTFVTGGLRTFKWDPINQAWTSFNNGAQIYGLAISDSEVALVGDSQGIFFGNGSSFSPATVTPSNPAQRFDAAYSCGVTLVVGTDPIVHGNGASYVGFASTLSLATYLSAVWCSSATDAYAGGNGPSGSVILHYNGVAWTVAESGTLGGGVNALWGSGPNDVFAGGDGGIEHWNGTAWEHQVFPGGVLKLSGTGPSDVFAVSGSYGLAHFDGTTWSPVRVAAGSVVRTISATPTRVFVVLDNATTLLLVRTP